MGSRFSATNPNLGRSREISSRDPKRLLPEAVFVWQSGTGAPGCGGDFIMAGLRDTQGWGLIGPGRFAREFAAELAEVPGADRVAVASRDRERAAQFAGEFDFRKAYGSYHELFEDPEVDIVYIVVPHVFHSELSKEAISAGKAVLCEKPLTPSLQETRELVEFARGKRVFLMEAMKTGLLPALQRARSWIAEGRIGEPKVCRADFCFRGPTDPCDRLMNPELAGGAVLDVGIYPLYLQRYLLGEIEGLSARGSLAFTGVEDTAAFLTEHKSGALGISQCSFVTEEAMDAQILGTGGEIRIPTFHAGFRVSLWRDGREVEVFEDASGGMVRSEIEAVMEALREGRGECPGHSHEDSIALARWMDEVRHQVGSLPS